MRESLFTGPVRTVLLLTAAAVLVVTVAATSSGSPVLFVVAAVSVGLVLYRTATLTSDLHRERTLSVQLDEALAQVIQHRDELEAQRHELQRLALYDLVTGLGNRVLLRNRGTDLGTQLSESTLLLLDLDGFKEVNDTLGHALGDGLLRQVG